MTEYMQTLAHISLTAIACVVVCYAVAAIIFCVLAVKTMVQDELK